MQAAWTPVEVGELGELAGADILVDPAQLELDDASAAELEAAPPTVRRNVEHLRDFAQRAATGWIGTTGNTTGGSGVPIAQLANVGRTASDPAFAFGTTVNVFRWGMEIDTSVTGRQLVIDVPANGWGNRVLTFNSQFPDSQVGDREVYWWCDMNATTGDLRGTAIVTQGFINLIPSPGTCGLLAFGLAAASRRRR